jgi:AcrR family transcriptional regulator
MLQRKPADPRPDGRRVRGADNRRKIVNALLKRVEAGSVSPSAEEVAKEAGVGLRTVFRHFADMESLYAEVSERMTAEIRPIIEKPYTDDKWRDRLEDLIDRRAQVFERLLPFKIAGDAHRHGSTFLTSEHKALVKMQRQALRTALAPARIESGPLFEALDLLLSFDSWRRLRADQGVSVREARAALRLAAGALTSSKTGAP